MRLLLFSLWLLAGALAASAAASISLAWDASPDSDVNAYRLYWGPNTGQFTNHYSLGNVTNAVFTNLTAGAKYYFVVTALNVAGAESDPSNEINFQVPVTPPKQLRVTQTLQAAASPAGPWREVATLQSLIDAPTNSAEFYRVQMAITPPPLPN